MATQTLAAFDAVMKNAYRGTIVELLNQETYAIDQFEKQNVNDLGAFNGRQLIFAVHTGRNRGRGGTTDGGALATAGAQSYLDGIVTIRYFNQAIELTDMVIKQSLTDEGAFVRAMTSEMGGAMTDMRKDVNRIAYGTGDGVLANWVSGTGTGASVTIVVDSGQYIAVGDTVDALTKANGAVKQTAATVTAVVFNGTASSATQAQAQITLSTVGVAMAAGDALYVSGDRNNESDGLRNICNTGRTLHGINSSTSPIWDSNIQSGNNANPSEDLFMKQAQRIRQRGGEKIDVILTTYGVQRLLANTYGSQKRFNDGKATEIDGGYAAIYVSAGGLATPVVADVDCPNGTAFELNKGSFAWTEVAKADWLEPPSGGGMFQMKDSATVGGKVAVWQAWAVWYAALVNVAPLRNGQTNNINDDIPITRI